MTADAVVTYPQAISNYRATLSGTRSSNALQNDDQWITDASTNTPVLVPSNGYTFERTDWQVRRPFAENPDSSRPQLAWEK